MDVRIISLLMMSKLRVGSTHMGGQIPISPNRNRVKGTNGSLPTTNP